MSTSGVVSGDTGDTTTSGISSSSIVRTNYPTQQQQHQQSSSFYNDIPEDDDDGNGNNGSSSHQQQQNVVGVGMSSFYSSQRSTTSMNHNNSDSYHNDNNTSSLRRIRNVASTILEKAFHRRSRDDYHNSIQYQSQSQSSLSQFVGGNNNNNSSNNMNMRISTTSIPEEDIQQGGLRGGVLGQSGMTDSSLYQQQQQQQHPTTTTTTTTPRGGDNTMSISRSQMYQRILNSTIWQISMIGFAFVLLFGQSIRILLIPPIFDTLIDSIFVITIIIFLIDIYMRCNIYDDTYFSNPFRRMNNQNNNNTNNNNRHTVNHRQYNGGMEQHHRNNNNSNRNASTVFLQNIQERIQLVLCCGSFLFYCDFISTISLLFNISWINISTNTMEIIDIVLDDYGIPIDGLQRINEAKPIELDASLFISILLSARVARFIRSSTAVKISSKVNWFYIINLCNPLWLLRQCIHCICTCYQRNHNNNNTITGNTTTTKDASASPNTVGVGTPSNNNMNASILSSTSTTMIKNSTYAGGTGLSSTTSIGNMTLQQEQNNPNNNNNNMRLSGSTNSDLGVTGGGGGGDGIHTTTTGSKKGLFKKQPSWNTLGNQAVVTVRMNHHNDGRQLVENIGNKFYRMIQWMTGTHRYTNKERQDEMLRQHFAAIRIQRAWRTILHQRNTDDNIFMMQSSEFQSNSNDVGWKGRMSHSSIHPNTIGSSIRNISSPMTTTTTSPAARRVNAIATSTTNQVNAVATVPTNSVTGTSRNMYDTGNRRRNESQVGSAMRELTGQRVAIGIIVALLLTVLFTYTEEDATRPTTMIVLHTQTRFPNFANKSLNVARMTAIPDLYSYQLWNGEIVEYNVIENRRSPSELRPQERLRITITNTYANITTIGYFSYRSERCEEAVVAILSTLFILLLWFFGVTAFAGPVMVLVVIPIERMVRLLGMLMVDPLGYQSTSRYRRFVDEENEITKNTRWTREILKGMETSFLMSTILRIGSLMKVGFGSAGVEIIRNNLEKGQSKNMLILNSQGSTVSCIFLFCDIRNFTDATECLQEEVFVFTNRIAGVVHSNVHSYGGSANKNVGDAFLLSWQLDEESTTPSTDNNSHHKRNMGNFVAKNNQADKCLLSVVRICMALHHDDYYIGAMTEVARQALVMKLQYRKGPIVQMGFGMHAGKAVQGAIGSQRKIDATYVSEAVERAEFLESSTKKYGVRMLMSDSFHRLLHPSNRRRCRKIDQILIQEEFDDDNEEDDKLTAGEIMELFTFDIDIDSLWAKKYSEAAVVENSEVGERDTSRRGTLLKQNRRSSGSGFMFATTVDSDEMNTSSFLSVTNMQPSTPTSAPAGDTITGVKKGTSGDGTSVAEEGSNSGGGGAAVGGGTAGTAGTANNNNTRPTPVLVLPTGPALYNSNVWMSDDMRTMRQLYSDGLFFQNFMSGLQSYYNKDWNYATQCFTTILQRIEDGPSRYFLNRIEEHNGIPPKDFVAYGIP